MHHARRAELTTSLLEDPVRFNERGDAYELLQEYFQHLPVDDLRALLRDRDPEVQRAAVWIASELGSQAAGVLEEVIVLTQNPDRYIAYHALETVGVCAGPSNIEALTYVLKALDHPESSIRRLAMRLLGNYDAPLIESLASASLTLKDAEYHVRGLEALVLGDSRSVVHLLGSPSRLLRRYGGILARRLFEADPKPITEALDHNDPDVQSFAQEVSFVLGDD